jgi:excisionase family DNA binding protein
MSFPPAWLTLAEASRLSGFGYDTLDRLVRTGKIASSQCGRYLKVSFASLAAFMNAATAEEADDSEAADA